MLASLPVCQPYSLATSSCNDVSRRASEIGKRLSAACCTPRREASRHAHRSLSHPVKHISRSRLD